MQTLKQKLVGTEQISESLLLNLLLACSGGFQDAYTYIGRGHVFANAQTGNIVLLSTHLLSGNVSLVLHYLLPVLAFAGGVNVHLVPAFVQVLASCSSPVDPVDHCI